MKKGIIVGIIVAILVVIGFAIYIMQSDTDRYRSIQARTNQNGNIVDMASSGFSPSVLKIKAGDTVTFLSIDNNSHWPASAIHPTHTLYPGSDIRKCGTTEEKMIFDACRGLSEGQEYKFTFTNKGSWKYHDHLAPKLQGTIEVN